MPLPARPTFDADVVVIGAGAAGLCAAIAAGRKGARVLLLEGSGRVGTKIRASGGGRCNILPSRARDDGFWSHSDPKAMARLLARWPLADVRAFFERDLRLALRDEAADKVFPASGRADDVVQALLAGVQAAGVELRTGARVAELRGFGPDDAGGEVWLEQGAVLRARRVVVCAGGLALPRSGSDGWGLRVAEALGHAIEPTYPALVPLSVDAPDLRALSGVALPVALRVVASAADGGRELAREDGDSSVVVVVEGAEGGGEGGGGLGVDGVSDLGAVDADDGDGAVVGDADARGEGRSTHGGSVVVETTSRRLG